MKQKYLELLKNKKVLITGSTGKIGEYISKILSNNKVNLILVDYDKKKLIKQKRIYLNIKIKLVYMNVIF